MLALSCYWRECLLRYIIRTGLTMTTAGLKNVGVYKANVNTYGVYLIYVPLILCRYNITH